MIDQVPWSDEKCVCGQSKKVGDDICESCRGWIWWWKHRAQKWMAPRADGQ